jgi:hypothetical protein
MKTERSRAIWMKNSYWSKKLVGRLVDRQLHLLVQSRSDVSADIKVILETAQHDTTLYKAQYVHPYRLSLNWRCFSG